MNRTIGTVVSRMGDISLDTIGFKGQDCEQVSRFLEGRLGWSVREPRSRSIASVAPGRISKELPGDVAQVGATTIRPPHLPGGNSAKRHGDKG